MKKRKKSIRVILIISLICIMLIPVMAVGITYQIRTRTILMENAELMMSQTLDETTVKVAEYLKNLNQPIDLLSHQTAIKDYVAAVGTETEEQATKKLEEQLNTVHKTLDGSLNVYLATPNSRLVVSTNLGKDNYELDVMNNDLSKKSWYQEAVGKQAVNGVKAVFQEPYIDDVTKKTVVTLTQEVLIDGTFYGVLGLDIEFESFQKFISEIQLLNTGYIMITNDQGTILSDHEKSKITVEEDLTDKDGTLGSTKAETKKIIKSDIFGSFMDGKIADYQIGNEKQISKMVVDPITGWKIIGVISSDETAMQTKALLRIFIITSITCLIGAIVIASLLTYIIAKYLAKLSQAFRKVEEGDLTVQLPAKSNHELGELEYNFNEMIAKVGGLVKDVSTQTDILVQAGAQISLLTEETTSNTKNVVETITQVAAGAEEQAESTQEATVKVEDLSDCINSSEDMIREIDKLRSETNRLSGEGMETVKTLMTKAGLSIENSNISKSVFEEMVSSIQNIDYISNAIADITAQTNLLSLNASIEAARAGEAGRGFAVVADEIRQLAEQSKVSTDQIKDIVVQITEKSDLAGRKLMESNHMLEEQNVAIEQTRLVFANITESIEALSVHIGDMLEATKTMTEMKNFVSSNISDIAAISEEYASSTEEVTATSEAALAAMEHISDQTKELENIASEVMKQVKRFKI